MATDPYGIQLGIPQIQGAGVLAGMQPLSFAAAASPVQVQPLAGWQMPQMQAPPSSHPEAITEGIAKGIDAITKGITAKRTQKREDENLKKKQERENALRKEDIEENKRQEGVRIWSDLQKQEAATKLQTQKIQADADREAARLAASGVNKAAELAFKEAENRLKQAGGTSKETVTHVTGEPTEAPKEPPITIEWSKPLQSPAVSLDSKAPPIQLQQQVAPLASIAPPSNAPFQLQPSLNEKGQFTPASTSPLGAMPLPSQGLQLPTKLPAQEIKLDARFDENGNWVPGAAQSNPAGQPAMPQPTPATQAGAKAGIKAPAIDPYKYNGEIVDAKSKALIDNAAREMGLKVKFTETKENNWKVADIDDTAKKEAAKQAELDKKSAEHADFVRKGAQSLVNSENAVKAYESPNGPQQMLPGFIAAFNSVTSGKSSALGISHFALLDSFVRSEAGGKPTGLQVEKIQAATSLKDRLALLPKHWVDGDLLSQNAINEMTKIILESNNIKADLANQAISRINANAMENPQIKRPPVPLYKDRFYLKKDAVSHEMPSLKKAAEVALENYKIAEVKGNKEEMARQTEIAKSLRKKYDNFSNEVKHSESSIIKVKEDSE